jgi:hypothetical protein
MAEFDIDEGLGVAHLLGGSNGLPYGLELTDEQIQKRVALCLRVWQEIKRQLIASDG